MGRTVRAAGMVLLALVALSACDVRAVGRWLDLSGLRVVAWVNGQPLREAQVRMLLETLPESARAQQAARLQAMDALVNLEVVRQRGVALGLDDADYRSAIQARSDAFQRARFAEMQRRVVEAEIRPDITVTDATARGYFEANRARLATEYRLRQARFPDRRSARAVYEAVVAEDFGFDGAVSRAVDEGTMTPAEADLGWVGWDALSLEWESGLAKLPLRWLTRPLPARDGDEYVLLQLLERREDPDAFARVKPRIVEDLTRQRIRRAFRAYVRSLRAQALVERVPQP